MTSSLPSSRVGQLPPSGSGGLRPYLGARAAIAVQLLNASFDTPPIEPDGDGWWKVPRASTAWDRLISAPAYLRWSDETVIGVALEQRDLLCGAIDQLLPGREIRA